MFFRYIYYLKFLNIKYDDFMVPVHSAIFPASTILAPEIVGSIPPSDSETVNQWCNFTATSARTFVVGRTSYYFVVHFYEIKNCKIPRTYGVMRYVTSRKMKIE